MVDKKSFQSPDLQYRVNPMTHGWIADRNAMMEAYRDYGYGGAVTNVPFADGFTSNPDNLARFSAILNELKEHKLSYWIYDEMGYPSGQGGGLTLDGHPELQAKGFYMHRRIAYEPTHAEFSLDDESDKIIWAAKYPVETPGTHESIVRFDLMTALPFTAEHVSADLGEKEIMYVFCVKNSYEGSHSTHNVSSFKRNINIMNRDSVRRFIDVCFEPIAEAVPDAYRNAVNVFTDEPSLHVAYVRSYEVWSYALAPWTDGLFEAYEKEYGEPLTPLLPLIFEGGENAYPVRIRFYSLVGKLIAGAYSGQLAEWCEAHGCGFSGHYLCEESITQHVKQYGDFVRVLRAASYPGIDVLSCYPEIYGYNTTKYAQIAVRKNNTNGMMVEICPFADVDTFKKAPLDNMTCVMGMLYLGGARITQSYFGADFSGWQNGRLGTHGGYTNEAETRWFNEYVGRLGAMLDNLHNDCDTFVYYGLEDAQAKMRPMYSSDWGSGDSLADSTTGALINPLYENGFDFYYIDAEDLSEAVHSFEQTGSPAISGCTVKTILIPALDVMRGEALKLLAVLRDCGVRVRFIDRTPRFIAETGSRAGGLDFDVCSISAVLAALREDGGTFNADAKGGILLRGKFNSGDSVIHMLCNKSRADATIPFVSDCGSAEIWNPSDGSVTPIRSGDDVTVPAMRAIFVVCKP